MSSSSQPLFPKPSSSSTFSQLVATGAALATAAGVPQVGVGIAAAGTIVKAVPGIFTKPFKIADQIMDGALKTPIDRAMKARDVEIQKIGQRLNEQNDDMQKVLLSHAEQESSRQNTNRQLGERIKILEGDNLNYFRQRIDSLNKQLIGWKDQDDKIAKMILELKSIVNKLDSFKQIKGEDEKQPEDFHFFADTRLANLEEEFATIQRIYVEKLKQEINDAKESLLRVQGLDGRISALEHSGSCCTVS